MANYKELNQAYKKIYNKDFPRATLTRWIKENRIKYNELSLEERKGSQKYDYDLDSFLQVISDEKYKAKFVGIKKKPKDFIGKTSGYLLIKGIVPKNKYEISYEGTLMYCDCLNCGKKNIQVRFSYLSGNGNYSNESCGCFKVIRHFLAGSKILDKDNEEDKNWLKQFYENWDKFSFLHQSLMRTSGIKINELNNKNEYKRFFEYFWHNKQFNSLYNLWIKKKNDEHNTFYDWWKPSLDHKIPKSRGGTNSLDNFQFLTYYENHNKLDMTWDEWQQFKYNTGTTSDLYLEKIMKGGDAYE